MSVDGIWGFSSVSPSRSRPLRWWPSSQRARGCSLAYQTPGELVRPPLGVCYDHVFANDVIFAAGAAIDVLSWGEVEPTSLQQAGAPDRQSLCHPASLLEPHPCGAVATALV